MMIAMRANPRNARVQKRRYDAPAKDSPHEHAPLLNSCIPPTFINIHYIFFKIIFKFQVFQNIFLIFQTYFLHISFIFSYFFRLSSCIFPIYPVIRATNRMIFPTLCPKPAFGDDNLYFPMLEKA